MRLRSALAFAVLLATPACDDFSVEPLPIRLDSFVLFSLGRLDLVRYPAAFDFFSQAPIMVEHQFATGNWDMVLMETDGEFAIAPPGVFPPLSFMRAGVEVVEGRSFEEVKRASNDESAYIKNALVPLRENSVYIIRTRRSDLGCVFYAKLEPVEINAEVGSVRFDYLLNPNCGDRSLTTAED